MFAHGLIGIGVPYGVIYFGEQYIPSGLSAVLFATNPFFVMVLAHLAIGSEPITARKLLGVCVGFVGVLIIFQDDLQLAHPNALRGAGITLLAPVGAALGTVGIKRWGRHLHPYTMTALPMTYAATALFTISFFIEDPSSVTWTDVAVGSILYLSCVGTVLAFIIFYTLLKHMAVSRLAFVSYTFPVLALILGYLLLGEALELQALAGAGTIVAGIALATR